MKNFVKNYGIVLFGIIFLLSTVSFILLITIGPNFGWSLRTLSYLWATLMVTSIISGTVTFFWEDISEKF